MSITPIILLSLSLTVSAQLSTPCPAPNPCTCTAALLLSTISQIPATLLPPVAWTPIAQIIPTISHLLDRPPPPAPRERSFLREIESATDAMFASQFAAHTVAFNARVAWRRSQSLVNQIRSGNCHLVPSLTEAPTADVFAARFPPTRSVVSTLISYDSLRTVIRPYKRALSRTETLFSNFTRNVDVRDAVQSAVNLFQDIVASGFNETITLEKVTEIDALQLKSVFDELVYGWYRARKSSERRVFLAIADQIEPLKRVPICSSAPVNTITCAICT